MGEVVQLNVGQVFQTYTNLYPTLVGQADLPCNISCQNSGASEVQWRAAIDNGKVDIYFIRPGWQMIASTAHLNFGLAKPEVLNDRRRLRFPRVNHPSGSGFPSLACPAAFLKNRPLIPLAGVRQLAPAGVGLAVRKLLN